MVEKVSFYKTTYTVTVLSDRVPEEDLQVVAREAVQGDYSWSYEITCQKEVTPEEMAELLIEQGSEPSFLLGDDYLYEG